MQKQQFPLFLSTFLALTTLGLGLAFGFNPILCFLTCACFFSTAYLRAKQDYSKTKLYSTFWLTTGAIGFLISGLALLNIFTFGVGPSILLIIAATACLYQPISSQFSPLTSRMEKSQQPAPTHSTFNKEVLTKLASQLTEGPVLATESMRQGPNIIKLIQEPTDSQEQLPEITQHQELHKFLATRACYLPQDIPQAKQLPWCVGPENHTILFKAPKSQTVYIHVQQPNTSQAQAFFKNKTDIKSPEDKEHDWQPFIFFKASATSMAM